MFDTEYTFEELALTIGNVEVALFDGVAHLAGEVGPHDYGFECVEIELNGNAIGNYADKRTLRIHAKSEDPFLRMLFHKLKDQIEADKSAEAHFYAELEDYRSAA